MADSAPVRHRMSLEAVRPTMAKAQIKSLEVRDFRAEIGQAIERAISLAGWTKKEAAGELGVEPAQLSRWIAGTERPQLDRLFAVEALRWPLIQMLARLDQQVEIITDIRRRTA